MLAVMTHVLFKCQSGDISAEIRDERLLRFYQYWLDRKGARRFPSRSDIDPLDFPYLLGNVMLVDALRDPLRFRVRLHGSNMVMRAGYDLTGKFVDDLPIPEYRRYVIERCKGLVKTGAPLAVRHDRVLGGQPQRYEALWLPFSSDGTQVTMLVCTLIYMVDAS
jgi:hypothetical protein